MSHIVRAITVIAVSSSLAACATVTRGTSTAWQVNTTPAGAQVKTNTGYACDSTPCAIKMPRKSVFTATISKEGFKSLDVSVTNKVSSGGSTAMAGNVLIGGLIGAGVDVSSGAMLDLTPNPVNLVLEAN